MRAAAHWITKVSTAFFAFAKLPKFLWIDKNRINSEYFFFLKEVIANSDTSLTQANC